MTAVPRGTASGPALPAAPPAPAPGRVAGFFDWRRSELVRLVLFLCSAPWRLVAAAVPPPGATSVPDRKTRWRELPGRFFSNPVLIVELRRVMRGRRPVMLVTAYLLLLIVVGVMAASEHSSYGIAGTRGSRVGQQIVSALFWFQLIGIMVIIPGVTATAITQEREQQTFDMVRMTLLGAGELLAGKLLVALCLSGILIIIGMPLYAVAFVTGGAAPLQLAIGWAFLLVFTLLVAAVCILVGIEVRRNLSAIIVSYLLTCWLLPLSVNNPSHLMRNLATSNILSHTELLPFVGIAAGMLAVALLLLAFARERLAGWRERGRLFRIMLPVPLLIFYIAVLWETPFSHSELFGLLGATICYCCALAFLFGVRPPHPAQQRLPLWQQLSEEVHPKTMLFEDALSFPAYLGAVYTALTLLLALIGVVAGEARELGLFLMLYLFGLCQLV
ncbi:MAG TPA: hypothetical protein PKM88_02045, partial [bacterium]|nr:hypothetical protein [bacterium]